MEGLPRNHGRPHAGIRQPEPPRARNLTRPLGLHFERRDGHNSGLYSVVSVPSPNSPDIVVSQFADDHGLSKENVLDVSAGVSLRDGAELADYYPVGSDIADGKMYILSRNYQTLRVVDMDTVEVVEAWELPEIGDYHGIAVTDDAMFVLSHDDGTDVVHELAMP